MSSQIRCSLFRHKVESRFSKHLCIEICNAQTQKGTTNKNFKGDNLKSRLDKKHLQVPFLRKACNRDGSKACSLLEVPDLGAAFKARLVLSYDRFFSWALPASWVCLTKFAWENNLRPLQLMLSVCAWGTEPSSLDDSPASSSCACLSSPSSPKRTGAGRTGCRGRVDDDDDEAVLDAGCSSGSSPKRETCGLIPRCRCRGFGSTLGRFFGASSGSSPKRETNGFSRSSPSSWKGIMPPSLKGLGSQHGNRSKS